MISIKGLYPNREEIFAGESNDKFDWKVQDQLRYSMEIEKNYYRTHGLEIMYKISKVKKACRDYVNN
jgi:hypothetical protein